ncbi:MAG: hypothetical protein Q9211_000725 [Gyalolechia sp. 1 TL-2023]
MSAIEGFSPTTTPPDSLIAIHKLYRKLLGPALAHDTGILDFNKVPDYAHTARLVLIRELDRCLLPDTLACFEGSQHREVDDPEIHGVKVYEHQDLPGESMSSFFHSPPDCPLDFPAVDPNVHKPLPLNQFLNRKLRWMTLGGQYDWTKKEYPKGAQPDFPADIYKLIHGLFPETRPEAAIVNVYSPGDTLSVHRDVSETSDAGLVSISLGCDGLFIAGLEDQSTGQLKHVVIRLRSGDAVLMSGPSRFAWHSVPQIVANTCPPWLSDWPADTFPLAEEANTSNPFDAWRGWMAKKRINLNIRQMRD